MATVPVTVGLPFAELESRFADLRSSYLTAEPFPHVVMDDVFDPDLLRQVVDEFPPLHEMSTQFIEREQFAKYAEHRWDRFGPATKGLLAELQSAPFLEALEKLTGIPELISDPQFIGGGQHQIGDGGMLKVHADFSSHEVYDLDRRLNLLLYLNEGWRPEWNGQLELWDAAMTHCAERVEPIFGRVVIFTTTSTSYHGHPDPIHPPEGITRKSLALYYYTNGRPAGEVDGSHSTLFQARPGGLDAAPDYRTRLKIGARRWLPPAIIDAAKDVKNRI
jgi:Rps23 Pro-64 3,4-dihydroxylase Tpa1-like proline 4-hydroxylase